MEMSPGLIGLPDRVTTLSLRSPRMSRISSSISTLSRSASTTTQALGLLLFASASSRMSRGIFGVYPSTMT